MKVGGLSGIVADLRLTRGWTKDCIYSDGLPVQPLAVGHYARPDVFTVHVDTRAKSLVVFEGNAPP